ncbi:hypothetical protein BT69DRAFT_271879 [Atractiella rhizophila]|nr:hypothetical protein BT69DRAFT_271879 [Atractiella rhizophila]
MWDSVVNVLGQPTGLCVPLDLDRFVYTAPWTSPRYVPPESLELPQPSDENEQETLTALANLSNHMLANSASKTLARIKLRHPGVFRDPGMYYRSLESLGDHHYRLPVRRYILELFDVPIDQEGTAAIMAAGEKLREQKKKEGDSRRPTDLQSDRPQQKETVKEIAGATKVRSEPILKISGFILS